MRGRLSLLALCAGLSATAVSGGNHGIDLSAIDRSVAVKSPADLYRFANGNWLDRTALPADKSFIAEYTILFDRNLAKLRDLAEQAARRGSRTDADRLVGAFYRVGMDQELANKLGEKPLRPELAAIDRIHDRPSLAAEIARLGAIGVQPVFTVYVAQDERDVSSMLLQLVQGGTTLPDRELYLNDDPRSRAIRRRLADSYAEFFRLCGYTDGSSEAARALELETRLAKASSTPVEMRAIDANYHRLSAQQLHAGTPHMPWAYYFKALHCPFPSRVNLAQPRFFAGVDRLLATEPLETWRSYLRAQLMFEYSAYLSEAFEAPRMALLSALFGLKSAGPRWRRVLRAADASIGEPLGRLFVREMFPPAAKTRALKLVRAIKAALRRRLFQLSWMGPQSRSAAMAKLDAMAVKIGYPDRWRDYSGLRLREDSYAANVMRSRAFNFAWELGKLRRPVDRSEWFRTPQTADANYNQNWNEIVFPAGILQPGYFDPAADDATNFGAIGSVIGHEITHAFDDRGSQFDLHGKRANWWSPADKERYDGLAKGIEMQYGAYKTPSGLPIDGKLTLSENIADVGGLNLAYEAYRESLGGKEPPVIDGLTGDQRFFVAWAQVWRAKSTPQYEKADLATNEHSPAALRAIGGAADCPAFYRAFGLVVPENLPHLW